LTQQLGPQDNIAIRLDELTVLDIEKHELWSLFFKEPPEVVSRNTWVCRTGGGGFHIYFRGETEPVKADGLAELRSSRKQYVVVPPSIHPDTGKAYEWLSNIETTPIGDISRDSLLRLKQKISVLKKYKPLLGALTQIWQPEHRHEIALGLAGVLRKSNISLEEGELIIKTVALLAHDPEVEDRLRALRDTYSKPLSEVAGWLKLRDELKSIIGSEGAEELLNLLPQAEEEEDGKKQKRRTILSLTLPGPVVLEAIGEPNGLGDYDPKLLVYSPDGFKIEEFYKVGDTIIAARPPRSYPYKPYVVENFEVKSRLELIDLVHREIELFIDAEPEEKATFVAFIILSYVQECFDALPYLFLVGDNESGKSHLLNLMSELCYRPLAGVSHTAADLYSYLEDDGLPLTILEDEMQGSEKDSEKMKIYKSGYKKGARVARVVTYEGGRRVDYFNSYGLKIMAAEKLIENRGLMQRCVIIEMIEGYPEKDHYGAEDYERFARLRSELLKWRMKVLAGRELLPQIETDWLRGRDRELYLPLLTILFDSQIYQILERFLKQKAEEKKLEKQNSLEAVITRLVTKLLEEKGEIVFSELWESLQEEVNGTEERDKNGIARSMFSESYGHVTKREVASILSSKLGMTRQKTMQNGINVIIYQPNMTKLQRALKKYGVNSSIPQISQHLEASPH
jgi:hypothetical protein